ncbi:zinc-ribbon domain-containing protein [Paenibacillus sp. 276b]|uniref:zinc-ribbon domain-containing protein n=1 Tax=Paenibacillus sp. 276b TaxID=1566277 RepID=UPI000896A78A|nr:zinc-ribbon domain-containing protein [Paenibacillus sp. 276b]SEB27558.1 RNA polymerase, alpha chain C terminal domain [Paenibacillus sp. 276b]
MSEHTIIPLTISHSLIAAEWDSERNKKLTPDDVHAASHRRAWWVCQYGHVEFNPVRIRVRDIGCAACKSARWKKEMAERIKLRHELEGTFKDLEYHPEMSLKEIFKVTTPMEGSLDDLINKKVEARIYNCLLRARLDTVDEILELNYEELCRVRNLGDLSIRRLYEVLKDYASKNADSLSSES